MVDIEINAWSTLFLNLETNLILYLYSEKCIKFNQSESRIRSLLKFCAPFKINIEKREGLSSFEKPVFYFSLQYPKKSGLSKILKVSTLDIGIKQSGLKVLYSKVPSPGWGGMNPNPLLVYAHKEAPQEFWIMYLTLRIYLL